MKKIIRDTDALYGEDILADITRGSNRRLGMNWFRVSCPVRMRGLRRRRVEEREERGRWVGEEMGRWRERRRREEG